MAKRIDRRQFLKNVTASACGAAICKGFAPLSGGVAFAQSTCAGTRKVLVSLFLSGGPHGPSILVPRNTQSYFDKHPTLAVANSLYLDETHGLHPSLPKLHALYGQGKVVFMNGAGYPNHSRSHEDSTSFLGQGLFTGNSNGSGWAGRFAASHCASNEIFSLFSFRGNVDEAKWPGLAYPSASTLAGFGYGRDNQGTNHNRFVRETMAEARLTSGVVNPHQQAMLQAWETADSSIDTIAQINTGYQSEVQYPAGLGTRMQDAARLILSPLVSVRHIFVNQGGYDTHSDQNSRLPPLLSALDNALSAFWTDIVNHGRENDVIVLFYGEFGRTHENAGAGTDHGTGFFMGMLGNNLRGGVASPAYTSGDFSGGNSWVPVKFDYREVLEQILIRHQTTDPAPVFPENFNRVGLSLFI